MPLKQKRNLGKALQKAVKSMDVFGIPVSLTYKNEPRIKSMTGGLATLLMRGGVLGYLLYQCVDVLKRKTIIQSSSLRIDLTNEENMYKLTQNEFDIAYKVEYNFLKTEPEKMGEVFKKDIEIDQKLKIASMAGQGQMRIVAAIQLKSLSRFKQEYFLAIKLILTLKQIEQKLANQKKSN
ncbi:UNKNOWN [Stylonychia lemnae]|uniref:Uncharacterized protein n=1 Tax=Stylonychia lemnae TaxID=5949 RepID=A0A078A934_STYLE|nr:UNKNOWN [Stylonychia lemnae]|eukprot:CDW78785.1 UNKNOWN [Stylonychia lemnae]